MNKYKSMVASFLLAVNASPAQASENKISAGGDPIITYIYPSNINLMGGERTKEIDCGTLKKSKNGKLLMTLEFAKQVESGSPIKRKSTGYRRADVAYAVNHFARMHKLCVSLSGQSEMALRKFNKGFLKAGADEKEGIAKEAFDEVTKILGEGWKQKKYCPLIEVRTQCKRAYQDLER